MFPRRLFLLFPLALPLGCTPAPEAPPVYLGHLAPTGPRGQAEVNGIALAVEQVNADAQNLPHGRRLAVIHADVGDDPADYQSQAVRLKVVNDVWALVGGRSAAQARRLGEAALAEQVLALTLSGVGGGPTNPFLFPIAADPRERGKALARFLADEKKAARPLVLVDRRGAVYGELASGFREALKGKEGAAARTIEYGRGESEAAIAERVAKEGKPSAVLIAGTAPDALHWKRLLEEKLGGEVAYLFGGGEADVPELLVAVGGEGLVVPVSFHAAADDERARAFVKAYREKFEEPPPAAAALAHDAVSVYAQALRRAAEAAPAKVREQFGKEEPFEVLTGELRYTKTGAPRRPVLVARVGEGALELVTKYEPE